MNKIKAIWHLLQSDQFVLFTYDYWNNTEDGYIDSDFIVQDYSKNYKSLYSWLQHLINK